TYGTALVVQNDSMLEARSTANVRASLLSDNYDFGVFVLDSDATLTSVRIDRTLPRASDMSDGAPVVVLGGAGAGSTPTLAVSSSDLRGGHFCGILAATADLDVVDTRISDIAPEEAGASFGDGISIVADKGPARATVSGTLIERSARAALSVF